MRSSQNIKLKKKKLNPYQRYMSNLPEYDSTIPEKYYDRSRLESYSRQILKELRKLNKNESSDNIANNAISSAIYMMDNE